MKDEKFLTKNPLIFCLGIDFYDLNLDRTGKNISAKNNFNYF